MQVNCEHLCLKVCDSLFDIPQLGIFRQKDNCIEVILWPKVRPEIMKKKKEIWDSWLLCVTDHGRFYLYVVCIHKIYACN